jgi:lysozyme family protein
MTENTQRFNHAINIILEHEGGYTNDDDDPGKETNFGITERNLDKVYKKLCIPDNVGDLVRDDAVKYYKSEWWDKYKYGSINSLALATKIFDMAVHMGPYKACRIVQESALSLGLGYQLNVDGILGSQTVAMLNDICSNGHEEDLKEEIINEQKWFYTYLAKQNNKLKKFMPGWLKRANYYD